MDWVVGTFSMIDPPSVETIHEMDIALWLLWGNCGGHHHAHRPRSPGQMCRGDKDISAYGWKFTLLSLARLTGDAYKIRV